MVDSIPVRNAIVFLSSQGKGSAAVVKFTSLIPIHNPLFKCSHGGSDWQMRTPPINTMIISGQSTGRALSFRMNVDTNADETMGSLGRRPPDSLKEYDLLPYSTRCYRAFTTNVQNVIQPTK